MGSFRHKSHSFCHPNWPTSKRKVECYCQSHWRANSLRQPKISGNPSSWVKPMAASRRPLLPNLKQLSTLPPSPVGLTLSSSSVHLSVSLAAFSSDYNPPKGSAFCSLVFPQVRTGAASSSVSKSVTVWHVPPSWQQIPPAATVFSGLCSPSRTLCGAPCAMNKGIRPNSTGK